MPGEDVAPAGDMELDALVLAYLDADDQPRAPAGSPEGGQFLARTGGETTALAPAGGGTRALAPSRIRVRRTARQFKQAVHAATHGREEIEHAGRDIKALLEHDKYLATRYTEAAHGGVAEAIAEHLTAAGTKAKAKGSTISLAGGGEITIGAHGARHYAGAPAAAAQAVESHLRAHPSKAVRLWAEKTGHTVGEKGSANPDQQRFYERALRSSEEYLERHSGGPAERMGRSIGNQISEAAIRRGTKAWIAHTGDQAGDRADEAPSPARERVVRTDFGELRPAERLENGWLRVDGYAARTGILEYSNGASVRRELVLPEELFDPESMASVHMVPVTEEHPDKLLDAETTRAHQVGQVGEHVRAVDHLLAVPILITHADTVRAIETGQRRELSLGYTCELDPADPSLFTTWGEHDAIQRRRRGNHLAVVSAARAGAEARLRLDSAGLLAKCE